MVELVVLAEPEPEPGCDPSVGTLTGPWVTPGPVPTTVKEPEDVSIPFAGAVPLGRNVTTERNVAVERTVTVECKEAVAPTGIVGAVPNRREEAELSKTVADGLTEQDGAVGCPKAAEQTKSSTLGPSKPRRSIA